MMVTAVSMSAARRSLHALVEQAQGEGDSYVITRHGEPAATLIPVGVYEDWQRQEREAFFDLVRDVQRGADLSCEEADGAARDAVAGIRNEG